MALVKVVQHFQGEHGQFLDGQKELFPVHHQQMPIAQSRGCAVALVLRIHQCSHPEAVASFDGLGKTAFVPFDLHAAIDDAVETVACITCTEDHITLFHFNLGTTKGKIADGLKFDSRGRGHGR